MQSLHLRKTMLKKILLLFNFFLKKILLFIEWPSFLKTKNKVFTSLK